MTLSHYSIPLILLITGLTACGTSTLTNNTLPITVDKGDAPQWQSLIQDNNLESWTQVGGKVNYQLQGDVIVGTSIQSRDSSYLTTKETFSDFIFEVGVFAEAPLNSGVQFRSHVKDSKRGKTVAGYQMEIDTAPRAWSGGIFDQGRRGWLYTMSRNKMCRDAFKVSEWNQYRIEAVGNNIRTYVNDIACSNIIDDASASGFFALQVHSAGGDKVNKKIKWRSPKILTKNIQKHLKLTSKNTSQIEQFSYINNKVSDYQKSLGWLSLWDGESLISFKKQGSWQVKSGIISTETSNTKPNSLSLKIPSKNFELELDVKSSEGADNGIHYLINPKNNKGLEFQLSSETSIEATANNKMAMGAIYNMVAPTNLTEPTGWKYLRINKAWNRIRLVVNGNHIEHWINNIKMVEYTYTATHPESLSSIVFENSQGKLDVTNIKYRELPSQKSIKRKGDREGHVMKKVVPEHVIPPAPILSIEEALASFHVHPDFTLEVIANEPLIFDPVVAIYDAAGRIWALEMTTYMPDVDATGEMQHESQIVVLSDSNNDGTMDTRQVIVEKVLLPRALAFVDKGIIWSDDSTLYFSEISEKNDLLTLVKTEVIDKTYASIGNLEHKPNGLLYSLDNWYYNAKSSKRYRPYPINSSLPKGAKEIYRNAYWKMAKADTETRGQWGISQDDYGRHYFNNNSSPIRTTSFLPNVVNRNPKYNLPKELIQQNVGNSNVFPVRVTPGLNRGYMENMYNDKYQLKKHTAACGPLIYRGNQYPADYYGIGIAQEPAGNLVKATKITEKQGKISGEDLFEDQEILASTDERFRPVNAVNSPDGTITIVDFYHGILQHKTFLTTYLADQIHSRELERNKHIGRLYRLKHKNSPVQKNPLLSHLSAKQLVPFLAHANGWHRDMAQQLLVMKQDKSVLNSLVTMATDHNNHLAQIKALWVLEGLGENALKTLMLAANTSNNKVKRSVYRLAELLPTSTTLTAWLTKQALNANEEVLPTLTLASGTHQTWQATVHLINKFGLNEFTLLSLAHHEQTFLTAQADNLSTVNKKKVTRVMNYVDVTKGKKKLKGKALQSVKNGKVLFEGEAGCFGCHGVDGEGNQIVPPLNNSEWVVGSKRRLSAILLHGLTGPVTVNGKTFKSPMTMPGLSHNKNFTDGDLADIATYIRYAWANKASSLSPKDIRTTRDLSSQQEQPYTVKTLKAFTDK